MRSSGIWRQRTSETELRSPLARFVALEVKPTASPRREGTVVSYESRFPARPFVAEARKVRPLSPPSEYFGSAMKRE